MLESLFIRAAGLKTCNFIKNRLKHRCFPVNIVKFLRTPILKNICKRLVLEKGKILVSQNVNENTHARNGVIFYSYVNVLFCSAFYFI